MYEEEVHKEVVALEVTCCFPTGQGLIELQRRVAAIHADIVTQQLLNLSAPKEQKLELLQAVKNNIAESLQTVGASG